MAEENTANQHQFKAEVKQLLNILVHSLYTNREIFLRELISNASDALDKLRFLQARGEEVADPDLPLEVRIDLDKDKNMLVVTDTGIGMSREELIENIGTIAHSGSAQFLKEAAAKANGLDSLIGQFGVGFYSVFMAANQVVIKTRSYRPDEKPVQWRSDGEGAYTLIDYPGELARGTVIEVRLREEAKEFVEKDRVEGIIQRHSNFISFPITLDGEQVNTVPALWREPKSSITPEQYAEFYSFLTFDPGEPLDTLHVSVDAPVQFNSILFVPPVSPMLPGMPYEAPGLDLYVQRVLIQHGNTDLLPEYLSFLRGVVDSEDLPLNISRETLQENRLVAKIATNLTKQALSHLAKLAESDPEKYDKFWETHSQIFKLGYNDYVNRDQYAALLRFDSSRRENGQPPVSLDQYIERAKPDQKEIYYASGPSREGIALNPHMELMRAKGLEVLYLYEPIDEFALDAIRVYKEFRLKAIEHADPAELEKFDTDSEQDKPEPLADEDQKTFDQLLARIKEILGDKVTDVKSSARLTDSPVCLVNPDGHISSSMDKIMRIVGKDTSIPKKILEVNPDHRLVRDLIRIFQKDPNDEHLTQVTQQLFESALLMEGYLTDPHALVGRIQDLLNKSTAWYLEVKR